MYLFFLVCFFATAAAALTTAGLNNPGFLHLALLPRQLAVKLTLTQQLLLQRRRNERQICPLTI